MAAAATPAFLPRTRALGGSTKRRSTAACRRLEPLGRDAYPGEPRPSSASEQRASPGLVRRYAELVERGPDALQAEVLALTDAGQQLRSLHPLAGLLDPKLRLAILRKTKVR